jgi:hypothetical protein
LSLVGKRCEVLTDGLESGLAGTREVDGLRAVGASPVTVRVPVRVPPAVGVNVTDIEQVAPAAIVAPQVVELTA